MKRKVFFSILAAVVVTIPVSLIATPAAQAAVDVYTTPGYHKVNGREWNTKCEKYSSNVVRCRTEIKSTQIKVVGGKYQSVNGWGFNNLTYLPSPRESWKGNPLGNTGSWTAKDGSKWKTECDTPATGKGGCRSYRFGTVIEASGKGYKQVNKWVFNNIVLFSSSTIKPVTVVPGGGAAIPKPTPPADVCASEATSGAKTHVNSNAEACQVKLINEARSKAGLPQLSRHSGLDTVARNWTQTMVNKSGDSGFYHNPNAGSQIRNATGTGWWGENIAYNWDHPTGRVTFNQFWNSPGHKANMMNKNFKKVGVGVVCRANNDCWTTQTFSG